MKSLSLFVGLCCVSSTLLWAQSRLSIAPTYWFAYNPYSHQLDMTYNAVPTQIQASGYNTVSYLGLTDRYRFGSQSDLIWHFNYINHCLYPSLSKAYYTTGHI